MAARCVAGSCVRRKAWGSIAQRGGSGRESETGWDGTVLGCWGAGVLGCWGAGVLGCWGAGVLGCWGAGVLGCWGAGVLGCWGAGVLALALALVRCRRSDTAERRTRDVEIAAPRKSSAGAR
ncbi:hypothetical protein EGT33_02905 [Burkholderia multivorans]|nr:hypothetical protein EGT33_02905 [Burkholderia multivorans]